MIRKFAALFGWFFVLLFFHRSHATFDPKITWKVIETPHFDVIFDANHHELAASMAQSLEQIYVQMGPYFDRFPRKTAVIIDDHSDSANGSASAVPYEVIYAQPILPGSHDSLSDYGHWSKELVLHEYAHILSFQPRRGIMTVLYSIFGSIITPNMLLPRWFEEGVAVDLETRESRHGRLRSTFQDGTLRAMIANNTLRSYSLDELNETRLETWPYGARPYLFGSLMWMEMIAQKGSSSIRNLHEAYGGRVPYFLAAPLDTYFGKTYREIYYDMLDRVEIAGLRQLDRIKSQPVSQYQFLNHPYIENWGAILSPNQQWIASIGKKDSLRNTLLFYQRAKKDSAEPSFFVPQLKLAKIPVGQIQKLSWTADSQTVFFDFIDDVDAYNERSDIWMYDLSMQKATQITKALRAREPSVDASGNWIVFVRLEAGKTHLSLYDRSKQSWKDLLQGKLDERFSSPVFWDAKTILFCKRDLFGYEPLMKLDLTTGKTSVLLPTFSQVRHLEKTERGLTFTSSVNGVENAYISANLSQAQALTNSLSYIQLSSFDASIGKFIVTELGSKGFRVGILEKPFYEMSTDTLPKLNPLLDNEYPTPTLTAQTIAKEEPSQSDSMKNPRAYQGWQYLRPRYWIPLSFYSNSTQQSFGFSTSASDPLQHHSIQLNGEYTKTKTESSSISKFSYLLSYTNTMWSPLWSLNIGDYKLVPWVGTYEVDRSFQSVTATWPLDQYNKYLSISLGYQHLMDSLLGVHHEENSAQIRLSYSDVSTASGAQVESESGSAWNVGIRHHESANSLVNDRETLSGSYKKYFSKFLPAHHVLMFRGQILHSTHWPLNKDLKMISMNPSSLTEDSYIFRGRPAGTYGAKDLKLINLEYSFPLLSLEKGFDEKPIYLRRMNGRLVLDALSLTGIERTWLTAANSYLLQSLTNSREVFASGAELEFDTTVGYHFPLTWVFGWYKGSASEQNDHNQFMFFLKSAITF